MDKTHYEHAIKRPDFVARDFWDDIKSVEPLDAISVIHAHTRHVEGDYAQFTIHPIIQTLAHLIAPVGQHAVTGQLTTNVNMLWHLANYVRGGKRTYVVAPGLARRLLVTELRGLCGDDLGLPYPSLYVVIDPELGFKTWNPDTGWHRVTGAYMAQDGDRRWRILICAQGAQGRPEWDDALSAFDLNLTGTVDAALDELRQRVSHNDQDYNRACGLPPRADEIVDDWVAVFKWLLNLIMFVTHADAADLEHVDANAEAQALFARAQRAQGKKRERLHARLRELPRRPRIVVGARVVVDERWPLTTGQARTLLVRTLVAGHWQRYHVGTGRQDTVWRFRQPFWRGQGDEGPTVHEVGDGDSEHDRVDP
jgi:hypothetical protein